MPSTASAASPETAAATSATARFLWPGFIDYQVASAEVLAVHGIDRPIRFFVIGDFHESESTRLTGKAIANQIDG